MRRASVRRLAVVAALLIAPGARLVAQGIDGALTVRSGRTVRTIATVTDAGARFVPVAALATSLGGRATVSGGTARVEVAGLVVRLTVGAREVVVGETRETLGAAARRGVAGVLVHESFVTDLLPRLGTGVVWDPDEKELRQFSTFARKATPAPIVAPAAVDDALAADEASDPVAAAVGAAPRGGTLRADADARPVRLGGGAAVPVAPAREGDAATARPAPTARPGVRRARSIVIDAGHGGPDAGMSGVTADGRRVFEKDITLAVALLIHVNAANPKWREPAAARGFETYFLAEAKTEDESRVEAMENAAVRFETGVNAPRNDPLSFIINDMAQNEHLRESSEIAALVQRRIKGVHPGPDRGVKQANFAVLRTSFMPAVLIELGFGTNRSEAGFLTDPTRQRELATAVADAAMDYLARYERRVGGSAP
ncbi:MAG: N-acetylmuramoyl-L-alanine amidase [Gemmatimonadaceae bacterium]|nr:N-acetylmuramoyl-L-alanine amidase [Gemmatimonadaceae bacterium]